MLLHEEQSIAIVQVHHSGTLTMGILVLIRVVIQSDDYLTFIGILDSIPVSRRKFILGNIITTIPITILIPIVWYIRWIT